MLPSDTEGVLHPRPELSLRNHLGNEITVGVAWSHFWVYFTTCLNESLTILFGFFSGSTHWVTSNLSPPTAWGFWHCISPSAVGFILGCFTVFTTSAIASSFCCFNWYFPECDTVNCHLCFNLVFTQPLGKFLFGFPVLPGLGPAPGASNYGAGKARQRPRYLPPGSYEVPPGLFSWQECRYKNKGMVLGLAPLPPSHHGVFGREACNDWLGVFF